MSLIRPEVAARLQRWHEVIAALLALAFGLWVLTRGGWLFGALGLVIAGVALGLARAAWQRLRFVPQGEAPGVIEIDEGQVAWFGPGGGGFLSLAELTGLGLIRVQGLRCWQLRQSDGQALLIPVAAEGADRLYDALTALPGIEGEVLVRALATEADQPFLWRRDRDALRIDRRP